MEKKVVPVERIRMGTTTVTGEQTVSDDVRKEQIEVDDPATGQGAAAAQGNKPAAEPTPRTGPA